MTTFFLFIDELKQDFVDENTGEEIQTKYDF